MPNPTPKQPPDARSGSAAKASRDKPGKPSLGLMHVLLAPVRATKKLFASKVRLQRKGLNVHIVLEHPVAAPPQQDDVAQDVSRSSGMQQALKAVLDQNPDHRHVLRHLVYFEAAFKRKRMRVLNELPIEVLQKALDQFEMLVSDWSHEGLSTLRSRMSLALIQRGKLAAQHSTGQSPSDFHVEHKMSVEEASVSRFMAVHRDWHKTQAPA
jgi:hypothetical protein